MTDEEAVVEGHGGQHMLAAAQAYGVRTLFTLSGAHIFPLYDAAVGGLAGYESAAQQNDLALASGPVRLVDTRHEATAVFAAEATAKLSRTPGMAAVTAGPGVTNATSALASAHFNGAPMVVVGGRAPAFRWGSGALQEIDHLPLVGPITVHAETLSDPETIGADTSRAFAASLGPERGPAFVDVPMDRFYTPATAPVPRAQSPSAPAPDFDVLARAVQLLVDARHPVIVLGSDVWMAGAENAVRDFVDTSGVPVVANGMARGVLSPTDEHLVTRARSQAFTEADLVIVIGTPLDFRIGYGVFGEPPAAVVHLVDHPSHLSQTAKTAERTSGDLTQALEHMTQLWRTAPRTPDFTDWRTNLRTTAAEAIAGDTAMLAADTSPIHPARIYGELLPRLTDETVVIGDGGDFVSFAGRFIEPSQPGHWLDPGPFGCLGTGLGYALGAGIAKPDSPLVLLLGDGAAGFSLMDVETLVRHRVPVAMVMGNNSAWGLEKHPMRLLHGYDVAADLQPGLPYHQVVQALGGAGEEVRSPSEIGPALDRALAADVPYLVNVITDPEVMYPRSTTGL